MERKEQHEVERALIKKFRKEIWARFIRGMKDYELVKDGDKIGVAISGGKDSLVMAKCFQELQRHGQTDFQLEFICMDPGYTPQVRRQVEETAARLGIPLKIHDSDVFAVAEKLNEKSPCYMCARMRRGNLYAKAQELGCNKLALGHHFDDVIETILLNILFGSSYKTMMPKIKALNFPGMELIRPLYRVEEKDIIRFLRYTGFQAIDCACTVTSKEGEGSKRDFVKELIADLEKVNPTVKMSIFRSAENIPLGSILSYKEENGTVHHFLEQFKEER